MSKRRKSESFANKRALISHFYGAISESYSEFIGDYLW
ncbi:hypothetical protein [Azospirillum argentinense]